MKEKLSRLADLARHNAARVSVGATALLGAALAHADPADPFNDAITAMTTKITGYGAGLVGLGVVGVGFMIGLKYVKKIPRAS